MSGVFVAKRVVLVVVLALMLFVLGSFVPANQATEAGLGIKLVAPPFLNEVKAQTDSYYLDELAGISAWAQGTSVNITSVRSICETVEVETSDYIICSMDVPSYADRYDPHFFAHKDGWILAFYLRFDENNVLVPASKMLNPIGRTLNNTLLSNAVSTIATAGSSSISTINYYDFRYPEATNMLFVAEDTEDGNYFSIQMPCSYLYSEKSWALADTYYANFYLNDTNFYPDRIYADGSSAYGVLPPIECGITNTFTVHVSTYYGYGAIVITYRVP